MHRIHRLILFFSVAALAAIQPAAAQFEVSPDHFDDPHIAQTPEAVRAEQKLRDNIAEEQALLDSYARQLAVEARQAEDLRQEAISAGIAGDGGGMLIAAFRSEQEELQALQASLSPLMDFSHEVLAAFKRTLRCWRQAQASPPARAGLQKLYKLPPELGVEPRSPKLDR